MLEKNNDLEAELEKLNVTVNERRHIHEVNRKNYETNSFVTYSFIINFHYHFIVNFLFAVIYMY